MVDHTAQRSRKARELWPQSDVLRLGMNWSEEDLDKPQILIDDAWGESHPCSVHLNTLSQEVAIGVWEAGYRPAQFHVTDICDGWAQGHEGMNYILASRDTMADMVELHGSVWPWDGVVVVSASDKSIPAHLMAIARLNLPAIHVPGGSMRPGPGFINTILGDVSTAKKAGTITDQEVRRRQLAAATSCGACQFMGTASTMQCMSEALGLALPGSAVAPATMSFITRQARRAGKMVARLVAEDIRPSDILTPKAFENAVILHAAIGGSTNATLHLPAILAELGIEASLDTFDRYNKEVPHLAWVQPSGQYPSELFWYAGGVPLVQWYLRDFLHLDALTVTGKTLGENLEELHRSGYFEQYVGFLDNYGIARDSVISKPSKGVTKSSAMGSIAILKGNLAPQGAVVKYSAVSEKMMQHTGPARVFDSEEDCCQAITAGQIRPGDVLVLRYEGPRGSGMPEMLMTTEALMEIESLADTTVLVTDGRFSGGTRGPCIGHVAPEAAEGGPIALVQEGDLIEIDIPNRRLEIIGINGVPATPEVIAAELQSRRSRWQPPLPRFSRGVMAKFTAQGK